MKLLVLISLLITCFFSTTLVLAQEPTPIPTTETKSEPQWNSFEAAFKQGVTSYQAKRYEEARLAFGRALELNSESLSALVNLGLTEFQLGETGLAVAHLRRASNIDPNFSTSREALAFILPQLEVKEIPHEILWSETLREYVLVPVSLNTYLGLTALFLFAAGWLAFKYVGLRKRALQEETAPPGFPLVATLAIAGLLIFGSLTVYKAWDHQVPRATVVVQKVPVQSAPDEKSPTLFELYAGLEVVMNSSQENWIQVTYPGALSGWVPKSAVLQTSGKQLW